MRKPLFVLALILVMGAVTAGTALFTPGLLPEPVGARFAQAPYIEPAGVRRAQPLHIEPLGAQFAREAVIDSAAVVVAIGPAITPVGVELT